MNYKVNFTNEKEKRAMKDVFGATVAKMGEDPKFVYLDADLMSSIGTKKWADAHPTQAYNVGVSEANLAGMAAGLASSGLKPLAHTFGPFASRRCYDQVYLSIGYTKNDVIMIGSDAGVTAAYNGGTHMPFEDMALYRAIPHATVIDVTDSAMLENVLPKLLDMKGLKYVRLGRKEVLGVYEAGADFEVGKAALVKDGSDVAIIACGIMVAEALKAAAVLEAEGIKALVLDMFTVKPIDAEAVIAAAKKTGAIVTAENHNVIGGLGSAVADVLVKNTPVPMEMVGVQDEFGQVGPQDFLQNFYGLTSEVIVEKVKAVIARK
ncbi:MAG: transketolase C-terminal domain-containing protein [Eubacteriales bacterium]|nr:transketolase C-terminal domain-containing protein [Eubacteriales bacterium]